MTEESRFLTDKRIFLNAPGSQKSGLYYTKDNSEVDMIESTFWTGRFSTSLTNLSFGGSGAVNIPNQMFVGSTYLQVRVPALVANQYLPRGWLFSIIERIDYVFGGANVGNLTINGQTLFQINFLQCETEAKRTQMLQLAGESSHLAGGSSFSQGAQICLPLPWSGMCGLHHKKPYDTSLLNSPLNINIFFKDARSIYGGDGIPPSAFTSARIVLRQGELANPGQGLRPILRSIPKALYNYPILHHQSFITQFTTGVTQLSPGKFEGRFDLQQFIDADLVGIYLGIIRNSDLNTGDNNSNNPLVYDKIQDVELLWNGTILYKAQQRLHLLMQMNLSMGASFVKTSRLAAGVTGTIGIAPEDVNMIVIDLSRIREECFPGNFANTFRIAQQTITAVVGCNFSSTDYTVFATYVYNGMVSTKSDGTSLIYFN